jgi:hypothetical protein
VGLVKEKGGGVEGETSELEVGSMIAGTIEVLILSLAGMGELQLLNSVFLMWIQVEKMVYLTQHNLYLTLLVVRTQMERMES